MCERNTEISFQIDVYVYVYAYGCLQVRQSLCTIEFQGHIFKLFCVLFLGKSISF